LWEEVHTAPLFFEDFLFPLLLDRNRRHGRKVAHATARIEPPSVSKSWNIADNTTDDWSYNSETGKLSVNKELVPRSKLRIEARQFHMSRLHPQQWGEKQQTRLGALDGGRAPPQGR
jgi:hypothetical protein